MNKLEVGMYVRTETGQIGKITNFDGSMARVDTDKFITYKNFNSEITKASHSIIDLIEEGDYVNGCKVIKNTLKDGGNIVIVQGSNCFTNEDIKSIATKEQFKAIEYKVESEVK